MNRIEQTLAALQGKKEKAFITYITAGLPDYTKTKNLLKHRNRREPILLNLEFHFLIR